MNFGNLFEIVPFDSENEEFRELLKGRRFQLQRIVSSGQSTAPGEWYDQSDSEWVVLLQGAAAIRVEGEAELRTLGPGDWLEIPARVRHRVEWTAAGEPTVWLALHYDDERS